MKTKIKSKFDVYLLKEKAGAISPAFSPVDRPHNHTDGGYKHIRILLMLMES